MESTLDAAAWGFYLVTVEHGTHIAVPKNVQWWHRQQKRQHIAVRRCAKGSMLVSKMSDTISLTHFDFDFVGVTTVTAPHFAMDRSKESELS